MMSNVDDPNSEALIRGRLRRPLSIVLAVTMAFTIGACEDLLNEEPSDEDDPEQEIAVQEIDDNQRQQALQYWTEERMAAAEPLFDGAIPGDPPPPVTPNIPGPDADEVLGGGSTPEFEEAARLVELGEAPALATEHEHAEEVTTSYTTYPHRTMGKLFFTRDGGNFVCSAAVIAAQNRSVVWTAGHCVADGGAEAWHENVLFVPAYRDRNAPLGRWAARRLATFRGWYASRNFHYDLAAVVVAERDGRQIVDVTGSLGWMFNAAHDTDTWQFGYPSAGTIFDGLRLWKCEEPYTGAHDRGTSGPSMQMNDCDYTAGASGGPWVVNLESCPSCYINSVNSLWWFNTPRSTANVGLQWAGPYHGRAAHNLLNVAGGL